MNKMKNGKMFRMTEEEVLQHKKICEEKRLEREKRISLEESTKQKEESIYLSLQQKLNLTDEEFSLLRGV